MWIGLGHCFRFFLENKADGLEERKYITAGWFTGGNSSVWRCGGREKRFLQFEHVLKGENQDIYMGIFYVHIFSHHTSNSQKVHAVCFRFLVYYHFFSDLWFE